MIKVEKEENKKISVEEEKSEEVMYDLTGYRDDVWDNK